MTKLTTIECNEYDYLPKYTENKRIEEIEQLKQKLGECKEPERCWKTLGVHFEANALRAHWFVGQIWLDDDIILRVNPKRINKSEYQLDFFQMYLSCLSNPVVNSHLNDCINIFWEEKPIPLTELRYEITSLIISIYLHKLFNLCRRHLRNNYMRIEENLIGKVKGKPIIKEQIRRNQALGRIDKVYCQYQVYSIDSRENQILKAALEQSIKYLSRYLSNFKTGYLWSLANFSRSCLSRISLRRIYPSDFKGIFYSGLLKAYKDPHKLAKLILNMLGTDPKEEIHLDKVELPPFAIDMNELFERYCEVLLRNNGNNNLLWVGYKNKNLGGKDFEVRPDFLIKNKINDERYILDSKYKENWNFKDHRIDVFQVISYSRHRAVLSELGFQREEYDKPDKIFILYPVLRQNDNVNTAIDLQNKAANRLEEFQVGVVSVPVELRVRKPTGITEKH